MKNKSEYEKRLVALSLFSIAMKLGPSVFVDIELLVDKIEIRPEFEFYVKDWMEYSKKIKKL